MRQLGGLHPGVRSVLVNTLRHAKQERPVFDFHGEANYVLPRGSQRRQDLQARDLANQVGTEGSGDIYGGFDQRILLTAGPNGAGRRRRQLGANYKHASSLQALVANEIGQTVPEPIEVRNPNLAAGAAPKNHVDPEREGVQDEGRRGHHQVFCGKPKRFFRAEPAEPRRRGQAAQNVRPSGRGVQAPVRGALGQENPHAAAPRQVLAAAVPVETVPDGDADVQPVQHQQRAGQRPPGPGGFLADPGQRAVLHRAGQARTGTPGEQPAGGAAETLLHPREDVRGRAPAAGTVARPVLQRPLCELPPDPGRLPPRGPQTAVAVWFPGAVPVQIHQGRKPVGLPVQGHAAEQRGRERVLPRPVSARLRVRRRSGGPGRRRWGHWRALPVALRRQPAEQAAAQDTERRPGRGQPEPGAGAARRDAQLRAPHVPGQGPRDGLQQPAQHVRRLHSAAVFADCQAEAAAAAAGRAVLAGLPDHDLGNRFEVGPHQPVLAPQAKQANSAGHGLVRRPDGVRRAPAVQAAHSAHVYLQAVARELVGRSES